MLFEFLIPRRPVSLQTKKKENLKAWKNFVYAEASRTWTGSPHSGKDLHLTLVYLFDTDPVDVDNIIKPIQDALIGLIYTDDVLITDVEAHRRCFIGGVFDITKCPVMLISGISSGNECVYVRVCDATALEDYL